MRKIRDLLKKISDAKRIFHAKMGSIKDRNSMDLTEAGRRQWHSTPVLLPGKFRRLKGLVGYSPWGHKRVGHD